MAEQFHNFYAGKRVLITGHTGFKGSWLSIWLRRLGAEVAGYGLRPPTTPSLFEACKLEEKITSILGDVRDGHMLRDLFERLQPEIVFHLAAQSLVRHAYREPVETYQTNVMGTVNLLEACRHSPSVRVVVNITSDKCYENNGRPRGHTEDDPVGGDDPYSSSKGCAELITTAYRRSYFNPGGNGRRRASLATGRAGNAIGGGDWAEDRLVPDCVRALSENRKIAIRYPDAVRPWQHVLEPLSGYLLLGQRLFEEGETFAGPWNFGPAMENLKPVRWIVERMTEIWAVPEARSASGNGSWVAHQGSHPHEAHYLELDSSKARRKLGWSPKWDLEAALERAVEWYRAYYNHEEMLRVTMEQIRSYEECKKSNVPVM